MIEMSEQRRRDAGEEMPAVALDGVRWSRAGALGDSGQGAQFSSLSLGFASCRAEGIISTGQPCRVGGRMVKHLGYSKYSIHARSHSDDALVPTHTHPCPHPRPQWEQPMKSKV